VLELYLSRGHELDRNKKMDSPKGERGENMLTLKNSKKAVVVRQDSYTKVVMTTLGNVEDADRVLYPTASCTWGGFSYHRGYQFLHVYCEKWEMNINRISYIDGGVAPIRRKIKPEEKVFFKVYNCEKKWDDFN
jgi:hypothetical protein